MCTDGAHLAAAAQRVPSVRSDLAATFRTALHSAFPAVPVEPVVAATNQPKFGDYQCNNAMQLFGRMKGKVRSRCTYVPGLSCYYACTAQERRWHRLGLSKLCILILSCTATLRTQEVCAGVMFRQVSLAYLSP